MFSCVREHIYIDVLVSVLFTSQATTLSHKHKLQLFAIQLNNENILSYQKFTASLRILNFYVAVLAVRISLTSEIRKVRKFFLMYWDC